MAVIILPKHVSGLWRLPFGGVVPNAERTHARLLQQQREYLASNPAAHEPQEIEDPIEAYVGIGAWRVSCRCKEAPHADPETETAVCFGCGAIWTNVIFPDDRRDIEDLLVNRPVQHTRNWRTPETFDDLVLEQVAKGDRVPADHMARAMSLLRDKEAAAAAAVEAAPEPEQERNSCIVDTSDNTFCMDGQHEPDDRFKLIWLAAPLDADPRLHRYSGDPMNPVRDATADEIAAKDTQ